MASLWEFCIKPPLGPPIERFARSLLLATVVASGSITTSCGRSDGALRSPLPPDARCPAGDTANARSIENVSLVTSGAAVRAAVADRIARNRLAVLHVSQANCTDTVEVLRCTRPVVWKTEPATPPGMVGPGWGAYQEPNWSNYDPRKTPYVFLKQYATWNRPSWMAELQSGFSHRLVEANREEDVPAVDLSELAGPDCARATHVVRVSHGGAFRALGTTDRRVVDGSVCQPPARCADPIDLEVRSVERRGCPGLTTRTPSGCLWLRRAIRFGASPLGPRPGDLDAPGPNAKPEPCIPPVAGQPTPELGRIFARFRHGDMAGTAAELELAGAGATRDEAGNQQLAQWYFFHAARASGDFAGAIAALEAISKTCHAYAPRAAAILAISWRRATVPPSE